jgi:hypothetical protein
MKITLTGDILKRFVNLIIIVVVLLFSCNEAKNQKVLPSGVEVIGQTTKADDAFFDTVFNDLAKGMEKESVDKVIQFFSKDYADFSNKGVKGLRRNLVNLFSNYENIRFEISNVKVVVAENDAASTYDSRFVAKKSTNKVKNDINQKTRERILWKKVDNKWKIIDQLTIKSSLGD